jgi:hypothetical protein
MWKVYKRKFWRSTGHQLILYLIPLLYAYLQIRIKEKIKKCAPFSFNLQGDTSFLFNSNEISRPLETHISKSLKCCVEQPVIVAVSALHSVVLLNHSKSVKSLVICWLWY